MNFRSQLKKSQWTNHVKLAWLAAPAMVPIFAYAQGWPERPVRVVVPFAGGAATDVATRLIADKLTQKLGKVS
jgi:tripartite-type tricarboxylate transporter receptor subunit TctC